MAWLFTGTTGLTYPQYLAGPELRTLAAEPGGTYDMRPAAGLDLPVPPADGNWAAEPDGPPPAPAVSLPVAPAAGTAPAVFPVP